jgi:hypothetical protein
VLLNGMCMAIAHECSSTICVWQSHMNGMCKAIAHECHFTVCVCAGWCAIKFGPTGASVQEVRRIAKGKCFACRAYLICCQFYVWRTSRYTREPTNRNAVVRSDTNDVLVCDPQSGACCHGGFELRCSVVLSSGVDPRCSLCTCILLLI